MIEKDFERMTNPLLNNTMTLIETMRWDVNFVHNLAKYMIAKDQEIARLNTVLINKGVEIAELKEQLANQGSCEGCVYQTYDGGCTGSFMIRCSRFPYTHDHYTPKGAVNELRQTI